MEKVPVALFSTRPAVKAISSRLTQAGFDAQPTQWRPQRIIVTTL